MKKVSIATTPEDPTAAARPGWEGARVWWLVGKGTTGSRSGVLGITAFAPGATHPLHRHAHAEQVTHVLQGSGQHLHAGGAARQGEGEVVFIPRGEWHGFRNDTEGTTTIAALYGGVASPKDAGLDVDDGSATAGRPADPMKKVSLGASVGDPSRAEGARSTGIGVRWLVTSDTVGSTDVALGAAIFAPGSIHGLHRHPHGEQVLFILEGGGMHLAVDGEVWLDAGEVAYIPANEWHGFRSDPGVTTRALFGYFGASSLASAGYEALQAASAR